MQFNKSFFVSSSSVTAIVRILLYTIFLQYKTQRSLEIIPSDLILRDELKASESLSAIVNVSIDELGAILDFDGDLLAVTRELRRTLLD